MKTAAQTPLILIDTREKTPWEFPGYRTKRQALKAGDYTLYGYSSLMVVERKGLSDFISCISDWNDWRISQLNKLMQLRYRLVLVDEEPRDRKVFYPEKDSGHAVVAYKTSAEDQFKAAARCCALGVPVLFAGNPIIAQRTALHFLMECKRMVDSE